MLNVHLLAFFMLKNEDWKEYIIKATRLSETRNMRPNKVKYIIAPARDLYYDMSHKAPSKSLSTLRA